MDAADDARPPADEAVAATRAANGTDVNFGALTNQLLQYLATQADTRVSYFQKVTDLKRTDEGWKVSIKNTQSGASREVSARFVFLGAGGARCRCCSCRASRKARASAASR